MNKEALLPINFYILRYFNSVHFVNLKFTDIKPCDVLVCEQFSFIYVCAYIRMNTTLCQIMHLNTCRQILTQMIAGFLQAPLVGGYLLT